VRPGITGLASVAFATEEQLLAGQKDKENFYITTLMPLKVGIEMQYCRNITFGGDLRILLRTLFAVSTGSKMGVTSVHEKQTNSPLAPPSNNTENSTNVKTTVLMNR
jgi:lipopolysaccharide/colanic/teichoic acid biosynthesis glycosyltransferase